MRESHKQLPGCITPMLATSVDKPFSSDEWLFELKYDGYRAIAEVDGKKLRLYSRNGIDLSERYAIVSDALRKMGWKGIFDGEIVVLDKNGHSDFQGLQHYQSNKDVELAYYVFDVLEWKNKDVKELPLLERKKLLKKIVPMKGIIRYSDHVEDKGEAFFALAKKEDMEGIMAKKKDSRYHPGIRTREWLKVKYHKSQEAIIVGFTEPRGGRQHFGSILLAEYRKKRLHYIGHAGTGFTEAALAQLLKKMKPLVVGRNPLPEAVKANGPVTWLKPVLVCEVGYSEITKDGILRHPVFKGLRSDKKSKMVTEETEKPARVRSIVHPTKKKK